MFKRSLSLILCILTLLSAFMGTGFTLSANDRSVDEISVQANAEPAEEKEETITAAASKTEGVVTPDRATATYSGKCGDNLTWALDTSTGVLNITGTGKMTNYSSSVSAPWYSKRSYIKTIKIGSSVTSIGDYAFYYCTSLSSVTIGDSVTSVGYYSFSYCTALTSITIPDSVTSIGWYAFSNCSSLTSVIIGNSITSIASYAFASCSSLVSVNISDSVTSIGSGAFRNCSSLRSITIPDSVTSIGDRTFYECGSLTSMTIPNSVAIIGDYALYNCNSLATVTIGNSVISIGNYAFSSCDSLVTVTIGNSVANIGSAAFYNCDSLTSVSIPDSVANIGSSVFEGCDSLTNVIIGNSVTSIGDSAFYSCDSLTNVTIPNSVTSIGSWAFGSCSSLTSMTIGNSVTSIGYRAFYNCNSLTSAIIGNSVTSIDGSVFDGCNALTSVYYGGSKADFEKITIGSNNEKFIDSVIYDSKICVGITVSSKPAKNTYYIGDALDTNGLKIKLTYNDGSTSEPITGYTTSYTFTATGTSRVVVSYGGYTTDFTVTVKSPKITINEKDRFDLTAVTEPVGYTVTWESSDKTILDVSAGKLLYKDKAGKATITASFTYNGRKYSAHYNVEVGEVKDNVISVSVSSMPEKTTYYIGDIIDTTGLKLKLVYSDGSSSIVASGFEIIDPNMLSAGAKIIYVSYDGIKTYFTVTVKAPAVKFSESSKSVGVGSSFSLKATTDPANIYVSYSSSDNNIASVDRNGRVTTITWGEAVITASATYNGRVYTAECVVTVSGASDPVYDSPFTDVKDSHWFADSVLYCVQQGYVAGMTEDTFVPNGKLTRAQFLTILAKFDGVDLTKYERTDAGFSDVKTSHWFNNVVCWAVENEYTSGLSADKFGPNNNITRAQLARFFYVYSEKNGIKTTGRAVLSSFPDAAKVAEWAKTPLEWAVNAGLISGVTNNAVNYLDPNGTATRAQAAVMFKVFDAFAGR